MFAIAIPLSGLHQITDKYLGVVAIARSQSEGVGLDDGVPIPRFLAV